MSDNTLHNARLNAFSSYLFFFIGAVATLIASPYLVLYLGSHAFSILKTSQKIIEFASIADGRSSHALKWVIASKQSRTNDFEKRQFVGCSIKVSILFFPLLSLVIIGLVYVLPESINGLAQDQYDLVRLVGLALGANVFLGSLLTIPESVLIGMNQGYRSAAPRIFWLVCTNVLMVYFAYWGYSLIVIALVMLFGAIMNALCVYVVALKRIPWLGVEKPRSDQFKNFLNFSGWVLTWEFVSKICLSAELILLGYLVGSDMVSGYVFSAYVAQLGLTLALMTGGAVTPTMARLLGEDKLEELSLLIDGFREILLFIGVVIGGGVLSLNGSFVSLWAGEKYFVGSTVNALIVISFLQLVFIRGEAQIQDLSLDIRSKVLIGLLSSVASVALAIVLYRFSNEIVYIFVGLIAGRVAMTFWFPKMVKNMVEGKYPLMKTIMGGVILLICHILGRNLLIHTWLGFLAYVCMLGGVLVFVSYKLILTEAGIRVLRRR